MRYSKNGLTVVRRPLAISLAVALLSLTAQVVTITSAAAAPGDITTVAGAHGYTDSGDGGPAIDANVTFPIDVATDQAGDYFISEGVDSGAVREVNTAGIITTVVGHNGTGFSGDGGPATAAQLNNPTGIAVDASGNLYIADTGNVRIRKVDHATGIITTIAGDGNFSGPSGDGGPATAATLYFPNFLVSTPTGIYITEYGYQHHDIRRIDNSGIISTIASGFGQPQGISADTSGNLYVADYSNNVVDKVDASGNITVVAGNGTQGYNGDGGPATSAELAGPNGVIVKAGNIFFSDSINNVVRRIDTNGIISTVAGNGTLGYSGDGGPATAAQLWSPLGVALLPNGSLLIVDSPQQGDVRQVEAALPPDLLLLQGTDSPNPAQAGQPLTYSFTVSNPGTLSGATGVTLHNHLPAGVTYNSVTASQGTCSRSGLVVTCALGSLGANATATVTITVTPTSRLLLTDTATVSANEADPTTSDNSVSLANGTNPAALAMSFNTPATPIAPAPFSLTATITNHGPNPATTVTLATHIPAGLTFNTASPSAGTCAVTHAVLRCALGGLAVNGTDTVVLNMTPTVSQSFTLHESLTEEQYNPLTTGAAVVINVGCGAVVSTSVKFSADMGPCTGYGVIAGADNVVIDLNGHKVTGSGNGTSFSTDVGYFAGVWILQHIGVTVRGGTVSGFDGGVAIEGGGKNVVTNMVVRDNIGLDGTGPRSTASSFDRVTLGDGIVVGNSLFNKITGNTVIHNGPYDGIGVGGPDSNDDLVQGNTVRNTVTASDHSGGMGISVSASFLGGESRFPPIVADNVIGNTVTGNAGDGISLQSDDTATVSNNHLANNGATGTLGNGIDVTVLSGYGPTATQDKIVGNVITGSGQDGIQISSDGNVIKTNSASGDNTAQGQWFDLHDLNPTCGANKWVSNSYGPALFAPSCAGASGTRIP